jgi:hypothetical protein
LIYLNVEFGVLVYLGVRCSKAVALTTFSKHLRKKHIIPSNIQKQVQEYISDFLYKYNFKTVVLLINKNALQLVMPIVDEF